MTTEGFEELNEETTTTTMKRRKKIDANIYLISLQINWH